MLAFLSSTPTSTSWLTTEMVQPIVENISSIVTTLLPVGISIMAVMVGVSLIPKMIRKFM